MADEKGKSTVQGPADTRMTANAPKNLEQMKAKESPGATHIYAAPDLGQTRIYAPAVPKRTPIFGWLVALDGPDLWASFTLQIEDSQTTVGSGAACEFRLADMQAAERHASIRMKGGVLTVTDLDTDTGTKINGEPVTRAALNDGDLIQLGSSTLKFRKL